MMRRPATLTLAVLLAATGCTAAGTGGDDGRVSVVAAFYPLQFVTERVGGPQVAVAALAPPGVDAHDLELTPSQVAEIAEADLVVYLSGFQPAVDHAVTQHANAALDVTDVVPLLGAPQEDQHHHGHDGHDHDHDGHDHGPNDPHLWLDPQRLRSITEAVADRLGTIDPDHAPQYADRADQLGDELAVLDEAYAAGLADCARREFVVSHAAFGYLADRYDLDQIAIAGLSPEDEPTPGRLAELTAQARAHGVTTIFFEVLASPEVAQRIANEVGATTDVLDPIEGLAPDSQEDYFSLMRANLDSLRTALDCT